jgi:hypothetical protein
MAQERFGAPPVLEDGGKLLPNNGGAMTVVTSKIMAVSDNEMRVYLGGSVLILKK